MFEKIRRYVTSLVIFAIAASLYISLMGVFKEMMFGNELYGYLAAVAIGLIFAFIAFAKEPKISEKYRNVGANLDKELSKYTPANIIFGVLGLIAGLLIAYLLSNLMNQIPVVGSVISIVAYAILGFMGARIGTSLSKRKMDFPTMVKKIVSATERKDKNKNKNQVKEKCDYKIPPKILDTSVIIDGRIADICKTGFIEGKLIVPKFVLAELQHIADSADDLKRVRGRRGLDILHEIQNGLDIEVEVTEMDFDDISEVDSKLLKLSQVLDGKVVTNDFNLNKVAQVQGVQVLNINELANSVKPIAIPGETMIVHVVKEGKENQQGIAYLDDGTMIVVDTGKKYMGQTIEVIVTSALQTPAGRMIFAKPKKVK